MEIKFIHVMLILTGFFSIIPLSIVFANALIPTITQDDIKVDNADRKEFQYCPDVTTILKGLTFEYNGCPSMRLYVDHWNNLDDIQKQNIITQLSAIGFRVIP